jgi:hypothetical protein
MRIVTKMDQMRTFEYRHARLKTGFPIDFVLRSQTLHGTCVDVSEAGICAAIEGTVSVGSIGVLVLHHPDRLLKLDAIVAHLDDEHVGLSFCLYSTQEAAIAKQFSAIAHSSGS